MKSQFVWIEDGHAPMMPKRGSVIHVSGIVSPYGLESKEIIRPGANKDGYWRNCDLVAQLERDLPLLVKKYEGKVLILQFDNSSNHQAFAPDALVQSRLNLSDGFPRLTAADYGSSGTAKDKKQAMRDTVWTDTLGVEHKQSFLTPEGTHKGIRTILQERGLWVHGMTLEVARPLLARQPDFFKQQNWISETVQKYNQMVFFGPKFHPELAPIEYYWGECKRYARTYCDYSYDSLVTTVPLALDSVSVATIRRHFAHVLRYLRAYNMDSLSNEQIEWAMHKFSSHRRIKGSDIEKLEKEFLTPAFFEGFRSAAAEPAVEPGPKSIAHS